MPFVSVYFKGRKLHLLLIIDSHLIKFVEIISVYITGYSDIEKISSRGALTSVSVKVEQHRAENREEDTPGVRGSPFNGFRRFLFG